MKHTQQVILFEERQVRQVWHNDEWYFSVVDVIEALTDSPRPRKYWSALKTKLVTEGYVELSQKLGQLKMLASDGKERLTDAANRQTLLRIIQSIPSPKAEPFKNWLAGLGEERIQELENPEVSFDRLYDLYRAKGYTDEWIDRRLESIKTRKRLTDEWKNRGVSEGQEYAILTAEIAKGTFGLTPSEHGDHKNLTRENLRDHMTPLELIFTALGEETTRLFTQKDDAQGFQENYGMAQKGGSAAGTALKNFEKTTGLKVVSDENFLKELSENTADDMQKDNE